MEERPLNLGRRCASKAQRLQLLKELVPVSRHEVKVTGGSGAASIELGGRSADQDGHRESSTNHGACRLSDQRDGVAILLPEGANCRHAADYNWVVAR